MVLTYYGHSCFSVSIAGFEILFDPFIKKNKLAVKAGLKPSLIPADYILISHGHYDHVDDAVEIAKRTKATVVAGYEVAEWVGKKGVKKVHGMNHGGCFNFPFGHVKFVNAVHSSTMPDGKPGGQPGGFVIESADGNFYYSGDTALTLDMQLIRESFALDFAVLCIGDNFTMGIKDSIKAAGFVGVQKVVGVHYDTFPEIILDHPKAKREFHAVGKTLYLPEIGKSLRL